MVYKTITKKVDNDHFKKMKAVEVEYFGVLTKDNKTKVRSMGKAFINPESIGSFQEYFFPNDEQTGLEKYWSVGMKGNQTMFIIKDINKIKEEFMIT